jgi:hypothetical protein
MKREEFVQESQNCLKNMPGLQCAMVLQEIADEDGTVFGYHHSRQD